MTTPSGPSLRTALRAGRAIICDCLDGIMWRIDESDRYQCDRCGARITVLAPPEARLRDERWLRAVRHFWRGRTKASRGAASHVWVVRAGERGEGGRIVGVYATEEAATAAALSVPSVFTKPANWKEQPPSGDARSRYWVDGCDYVEITPFEVAL